MRKTVLMFMLAATGCIHAQVKPLGEGTLNLETFGFDTKITDLYPEKNKNNFYSNGNVYNFPGSNEEFFERNQEKNGYKIYDDDIQKDVVVYRQISYISQPIARFGKQSFGNVAIMATPDGRIAAVGATARNTTESQSAEFVASLTKKYGAPVRLKSDWDENDAPLYEWIGKDRIIRYVYAVDKSTVLNVDLNEMRISQEEGGKTYESHLFIINPELREDVFPGGKRCTLSGNFVYINEKTD